MISSVTSPSAAPTPAPNPQRQAVSQLGQALRSGDVDSAKQAYASIARNAPEGTKPSSEFVALGKALAQGNVDGARSAFASMAQAKREERGASIDPPPKQALPSSTGGPAGNLLDAVA